VITTTIVILYLVVNTIRGTSEIAYPVILPIFFRVPYQKMMCLSQQTWQPVGAPALKISDFGAQRCHALRWVISV
jgi:hypothetical protein